MADKLGEICDYLKIKGVECRSVNDKKQIFTTHLLGAHKVEIRAEIPDDFPCSLPSFHLVDRLKYGSLAHVAWSEDEYADICYGTKDTFSTDYHKPSLVFWVSLNKATAILDQSLNDKNYNRTELINEFAGVWRFHSKLKKGRVVCLAEPAEHVVELNIKSTISEGNTSILGEYVFAINPQSNLGNSNNYFASSCNAKGRITKGKGVLVPVTPLLEPPSPTQSIAEWWGDQILALSEKTQRNLSDLSRRKKCREFYIICSAPVDSTVIWFAIKCLNSKRSNVPTECTKISGWDLHAVNLDVISKDVLVPRGGGYTGLNDNKVCLVGCGSIGGYVADMFASSGIGQLTLIDDDTYRVENLYRHYLPPNALFGSKNGMLKISLESKYPFLRVAVEPKKLQQIADAKFYEQFDVIVIAIASPSHERKFNEFLRDNSVDVPVVYTWVEPYGVGGHAVAVMPGVKGCLACSFIDNESDEPSLHPNISFLQPGQKILESIGGCGTEFIAFSSTDAIQTAVIATKLSIRIINGEIQKSTIVSWKGNSIFAEKKNLSFTHRYKYLKDNISEQPLGRDACAVCNG